MDELTEGGSTRAINSGGRVDKIEWPIEEVGSVEEWDGIGPSDVLGREGDGVGFELDAFKVLDDTVGGGAVAMPEWPPAAVLLRESGVG